MEDKVVIKGEFKGSKSYFRETKKMEKSKIDCVSLILRTIKIKKNKR